MASKLNCCHFSDDQNISGYFLSTLSSPGAKYLFSLKRKGIYFRAGILFHPVPLSSCLLPPGIECGLGPDELQLGLQIYEALFQCQKHLVVNSEQNRYLSPEGAYQVPFSFCFKSSLLKPHTPCKEKGNWLSVCRGSRWHRSEPQTVFLNSPLPGSLSSAHSPKPNTLDSENYL